MKDYTRLTERDDSLCIDCADIGFCRKTCIRQARYERLQFLENEIESSKIDYVTDRDKEIARLTSENAKLLARLEKAVELPVNVEDIVYCIRNCGTGGYRIGEYTVIEIVFKYDNQRRIKTSYGLFGCEEWTFGLDCFADRAEAESCLKELEEKKDD